MATIRRSGVPYAVSQRRLMLDVHMSQPELTKLVATSLPTLQRVMRRFACDGPVINKYARIQLMDRDALERLCRS